MGKRFEKLGEHTVCEDGETTPVIHMWFKEGGGFPIDVGFWFDIFPFLFFYI